MANLEPAMKTARCKSSSLQRGLYQVSGGLGLDENVNIENFFACALRKQLPASRLHCVSTIRPCPMVLPPSRMANRMPVSMGVDEMSSHSQVTSSPGMAICTALPSELSMVSILPVTSQVRK